MSSHPVIAVCQFAPGTDWQENLATIRALAGEAVDQGASLVVFPEYSSYFAARLGRDYVDAAQPINGPFVSGMADVARDLGIHLVAGLVERLETDADHFANTLVALAPDGTLAAKYRKLHLYDAFGDTESNWVRAGEIELPETFSFGEFTVGLQTCYDLRFPEVTRRLVDAGTTLVLVPSEWVAGPGKVHHWRTLLTARAIENLVYVAAADHTPPVGVGNSMILDPAGVELVTIESKTGAASAPISAARVAEVRATNPALALRRFAVTPR
ncbi:MAG: carbon-nitrogen hydrolase family protein [Glaciihabitans sp.]|nr:carbon-nitrogen hydrolase family protein [Glaciihabitans sp.]